MASANGPKGDCCQRPTTARKPDAVPIPAMWPSKTHRFLIPPDYWPQRTGRHVSVTSGRTGAGRWWRSFTGIT